ncbi:hypothetical protein FQN60_013506 [Etheostoma spectabile]|uniref:G-protein coupled receptors family 2 profile 2 domain-containing protein n=1 Tax=Etheostoma spectabile TaxID=54343 RepID=A0A5J5CFX3_9PERO|nr:hypothetical protein FQN60_013506 [Etheostoma spectabile]
MPVSDTCLNESIVQALCKRHNHQQDIGLIPCQNSTCEHCPLVTLGYFLGDTKAVLNGCEDHWTLQDSATMPLLLQMTLCVDIRVVVPGAWVAFSYSSVLTPGPELGLEGDDEALYGWLLRVRHRFPMRLSPTHWHRVCLRRDVLRNSFSLEVNGKMVAERTVIAQAIPPNGSLWLGCRPRDRPPGAVLGEVELYLFRMWADLGNHGLCEDGTVIGWNAQSWGLTSPRARQRDPNLLCVEVPSTTTTTLSTVIATPVTHMSNQTSKATVLTPPGSTTVNSIQTEPPSVTPSANHSTEKKPSNFQNSSVTPSPHGIPLSILTPVNQTTASNTVLPFTTVPVTGASSANQTQARFPLVNCDISQLCSNTNAYFWMSISVEAQGDNKTEQDVHNLVSNAFSCHSNAAHGVTGFIHFCQGDRQLQAVRVNCSAKSNIRQTTCDVLLQLSHAVSACELQRAGVSALQQAGDQQIQAKIIGEVERVGQDICGDVEPSSGRLVRCTSTSSLEEICQANNLSKLTCSLIQPNSNPAPQPNTEPCSSEVLRFCDCTAFCNSASQFFAMRININSASFNVNSLKVLLSGLIAARTCNTMSGSVCQDILKFYQNVHLECHGTPQSEANESLAILLTDPCPPKPSTTKQSTTQPSNLTNSTTTPTASTPSGSNTTAAQNTATVQKTNASQGTARPNMTMPLTTINSTQSSTAQPVFQTSSPNMTVTASNSTIEQNTTLSNNTTLLTPTENTQLQSTTAPHQNTTEFRTLSSVNSTLQMTTAPTVSKLDTTTMSPNHTAEYNLTTVGTVIHSNNHTIVYHVTTVASRTNHTTVYNVTTVPHITNHTTAYNVTTIRSSPNDTTRYNATSAGTVMHSANHTTKHNVTMVKPSTNDNTTYNVTTVSTGSTFTTMAETPTSQTAREEQAKELLNQTEDASQLNSSQVTQFVRELEKLLEGPTVSQAVGQKVVNIISNLMNANSLALSASANRLVHLVDDLGLKLVVTGDRGILSSRSLVLAVRTVDGTNFPITSVDIFNTDNVQLHALRSKRSGSALGSVFLPSSLTTGLSPEQQKKANRVQFTFYTKSSLFQDASLDNKTLVSPVLAASVTNLSISNLSENIQFTIQNINPIHEDTTCSCNHLTSFAILLDLSREGIIDHQQAQILTFITYIGCGISAIFLALTLLTYLLFEKLLRDIPAKILVQLCLSLLLLNLVFLLDGWLALYPGVGLCISTAFFLHYFLLTSFTWAGLEALHMYLSIVRVPSTSCGQKQLWSGHVWKIYRWLLRRLLLAA